METDTTMKTIQVREGAIETVEKRLAQRMGWCKRNGIEAPAFRWGELKTLGWNAVRDGVVVFAEPKPLEDVRMCRDAKVFEVRGRELEIEDKTLVKVGGWVLVGVLGWTEHGPIPTVAPNQTMPPELLERPKCCDHCQTIRKRTETFVLRGEGRVIVVGRNCIQPYLGIDPTRLVRELEWAKWLNDLDAALDRDPIPDAADTVWVDELEKVVARALAAMDVEGGYRKKTEHGGTAATVHFMDARLIDRDAIELQRKLLAVAAEPRIIERAKAAIEWAKTIQPNGELDLTLLQLAKLGVVNARAFGIACYLPAAHARALGEDAMKRPAFPMAQRVPEAAAPVGTKLRLTMRVTLVRTMDGVYGPTTLILGRDTNGHELKCWTTVAPIIELAQLAVEKGEGIALEATVKAHEPARDGNGTTTVITRPKLC